MIKYFDIFLIKFKYFKNKFDENTYDFVVTAMIRNSYILPFNVHRLYKIKKKKFRLTSEKE